MKYIELESVTHKNEQIHIIFTYNNKEYIHTMDSLLTGVINTDTLSTYLIQLSGKPENSSLSQLYYDAAKLIATGQSRGSWLRDDVELIPYKR